MYQTAGRLGFLGGLLLFFALLTAPPARAAVGGSYSVLAFKPWLERGYNTRLGWQGHPVSHTDPHLYLHTRDRLALLAELEYLQTGGRIHTQIFKLYQPGTGLNAPAWRELEWFALEASGSRLGTATLHALFDRDCQGVWRVGPLYVTLISERAATWLRISEQSSGPSQPVSRCLLRPQKRKR